MLAEVTIGAHARQLDDATQLEFAPGAGGGGGTEGGGELGGLGLQLALGGGERLELFGKLAVGAGADLFDLADLGVHLVERLPERLDERIDGLLALAQLIGGLLVELAERLAGELQELVGVFAQGVGGEGLELVREPDMRLTFGGKGGLKAGGLGAQVRGVRAEGLQLGGEAEVLLLAAAQALVERGAAAVHHEPGESSGQQGGTEGDEGKNHVKIVLWSVGQINPGCVP